MFALSDSHMFYSSHMEAYVGKQPEGPFQKETTAQSVVERLSQQIYGTNRNITTHNWFTSMELVESLKRNKLTLLGIIRKTRDSFFWNLCKIMADLLVLRCLGFLMIQH
ncbi:hypothetical protein NQ314_017349 [Rhamnusium bicolor]|uniref:PiggyBac transposable element-derived protein domain-containing protein n=1 Tax=Rhamnusium bicolor TaxID=1586634 RepID=A0AAV8WV07_9CUCU|nr:hypothetical protein NQ314_017349 [Rhamnusium bicolor]